MATVDQVQRDLHAVDKRLVGVETELREHRTQSGQQHADVMRALDQLRADLSDQGRTPGPPPSLPPVTPLPGRAPTTLPPEGPTLEPPSSDPGAITLSPRRVAPWLRLLLPYLLAGTLGAGATQALRALTADPDPVVAPAEVTP